MRADYDVIVLCTGYRIDLPFLDPALKQRFVDEEANTIRLYKNVFCPTIGPSLAFIGFLQPTSGGLLTMSEMQVRGQPRYRAPLAAALTHRRTARLMACNPPS